jgi:hypothetical protein
MLSLSLPYSLPYSLMPISVALPSKLPPPRAGGAVPVKPSASAGHLSVKDVLLAIRNPRSGTFGISGKGIELFVLTLGRTGSETIKPSAGRVSAQHVLMASRSYRPRSIDVGGESSEGFVQALDPGLFYGICGGKSVVSGTLTFDPDLSWDLLPSGGAGGANGPRYDDFVEAAPKEDLRVGSFDIEDSEPYMLVLGHVWLQHLLP